MKRQSEGRALEVSPLNKKMKATGGDRIISDLNSDTWSHVIEYLEVEEVITLVLVNRSIQQIISDHIRIIHPYCLDDEWSISRALMNHYYVMVTKDNIERFEHIVNQLIEKNEPITKFTKHLILYGDDMDVGQVVKVLSTSNKDAHENRPIVSSLERLEFIDINEKVALGILRFASNLKYLTFSYYEKPLDGAFLESLAKTCPKLKEIHLFQYCNYYGNYITDDQLFKFLQNEPHLEHIRIDGCARINGSIYSKMGQFKQLKYFNVERKCYLKNESLVAQCKEEPFTGDGVLPHLIYLNIGDEMKGVNVDHLLKMAPNVKDVGKTLFHSSSNYLEIVDKLANRLTVIPPINLSTEETKLDFLQKWLEKTTILHSLEFYQVKRIDFSKLKPIPSVKELKLDLTGVPYDLLKEISRDFPCIEAFDSCFTMRPGDVFIDLIREGQWPQLQHVEQADSECEEELKEIRPHLLF